MTGSTRRELSLHELEELIESVTGRSPGPLTADATELRTIGITSLHFFRLIALLEERTGITFGDDYLEPTRLRTLADLRVVLGSHGVSLQDARS